MLLDNQFGSGPKYWDRIKGLKLQRIGKLNCTYHSKCRSIQAAVDKGLKSLSSTSACVLGQLYKQLLWPQQMSHNRRETFLSLVYCGLCTAHRMSLQLPYTSRSTRDSLVYCGASSVGVNAPQFEFFYTVPQTFLRFQKQARSSSPKCKRICTIWSPQETSSFGIVMN